MKNFKNLFFLVWFMTNTKYSLNRSKPTYRGTLSPLFFFNNKDTGKKIAVDQKELEEETIKHKQILERMRNFEPDILKIIKALKEISASTENLYVEYLLKKSIKELEIEHLRSELLSGG